MADNTENEENPRPCELETHRLTPPPLDIEDQAEISRLSAEIDEADGWELTIEIVEPERIIEPENSQENAAPEKKIEERKTPKSVSRKLLTRSPAIYSGLNEEVKSTAENDENNPPQAPKKPVPKRKSVAEDLRNEFSLLTPPSTRKRKSVVDELTDMFHTPRSSKKRLSK